MDGETQESTLLQQGIRLTVTALAACLALLGLITKIISFMHGQWLHATGAIILYLLMFFLFIFRHSIKESCAKPLHWLFAVSGTLLPMALHLESSHGWRQALNWISLPIELVGMALSVVALYTLGRSFGIIAAKREIKTNGLYKMIRHPLYAGEGLWFFALVIQNLSVFNLVLFAIQMACQVRRIIEEESILKTDAGYAEYTQEVPWRLIPGVF